MQTIDIYEIDRYITKFYSVKTLINLSWNNLDQICFTNKKLHYPFCSFYFDICPKLGYAPGKLLIYHKEEDKYHIGSSGSIVYEGIESIDWLMQNVFKLKKKVILPNCNGET